jgi:anaerobic selenocysteine-containing dehydrogenase
MADIILPSNTTFEVDDVNINSRPGIPVGNITYQAKAIEPVGESKSDYEVVLEVAKKLGKYKEVSEGKSINQWIRHVYNCTGLEGRVSYKKFQKDGYYVFATAENWEEDPPGIRKFYEDPIKNPLPTPSGRLEFYSERLAKHFPDDKERPPIPKWIEKSDTCDERLSSQRAKNFPLLQMSNHGRWRVHAQCDDISWTREVFTCKIKAKDGYLYEPLWLNPLDAVKRNIKDGDIVKIFNERGTVLGGAYLTERIMPGVVYMDHGARVDWIIPGALDRGGAINLISPASTLSKHCGGMATSGYLVEIEKLIPAQYEEWKKQYPEAFSRAYDSASGLVFNAWVEGAMS